MLNSKFSRKSIYKISAVIGFLIASAYVLHAVFTSTSSTAPIGLIFIPVYGAVTSLLSYTFTYTIFTFLDIHAGRSSYISKHALVAYTFIIIALLFGTAIFLYRSAHAIASNPQSTPEMLIATSNRWIPLWREDIFAALAQNSNTPAELLIVMTEIKNNHLSSLIAANSNTPLIVLEKIANLERNYERDSGLAKNPNISNMIVERLANAQLRDFRDPLEYKLYQTFVLAALLNNPATTQKIFNQIAARENPEYFLAVGIIYAERSSCEQIFRAGNTGSDVLYNTAHSQLAKRSCQTANE